MTSIIGPSILDTIIDIIELAAKEDRLVSNTAKIQHGGFELVVKTSRKVTDSFNYEAYLQEVKKYPKKVSPTTIKGVMVKKDVSSKQPWLDLHMNVLQAVVEWESQGFVLDRKEATNGQ